MKLQRSLVLMVALAAGAFTLSCRDGNDANSASDDWQLYASPLGFTVEHPRAWAVQPGGVGAESSAKIVNELRSQQTALEGGDSGEAWVEIVPDAIPQFDAAVLRDSCTRNEQTVADVTLASRDAVLCTSDAPDVYSGFPSAFKSYSLEFPPGHTLSINTYALDTDDATRDTLDTIISTLEFQN